MRVVRGLRLMVLGRLRVMRVVRGLRLMVPERLRVMQAVGMVEQVRGRVMQAVGMVEQVRGRVTVVAVMEAGVAVMEAGVAVMEAVGNDVWGLRRVSTCLPAGGARTHAASS
jgi:hypothetical protein